MSEKLKPCIFPLYENDPRSFQEDFQHENGQYFCECSSCKQRFMGHKRRHTCKVCETEHKEWLESLNPRQRAIYDAERDHAITRIFQRDWDNENTRAGEEGES